MGGDGRETGRTEMKSVETGGDGCNLCARAGIYLLHTDQKCIRETILVGILTLGLNGLIHEDKKEHHTVHFLVV